MAKREMKKERGFGAVVNGNNKSLLAPRRHVKTLAPHEHLSERRCPERARGASLGKMSLMSDDSAAANGPSMFKAVEEPSDGNISSPRYNERLSRARAGNSSRIAHV